MKELFLPFYNDRKGRQIQTIVIHASAQKTAGALIDKLVERELSAHYVVDEQGEIIRLVPEACRAWHAGVGVWNQERDLNSTSIGIEMCNGLFGEEAFTDRQIEALTKLCLHLIDKYEIKPYEIIGHSDLAPTRKIDPGSMFCWERLAKNGVGLWYDLKDNVFCQPLGSKQLLEMIGYGHEGGVATEWAFLRRFNAKLYKFLGGKKGANAGTIEGVVPHDNPEYLRTLNAVASAFYRAKENEKIKKEILFAQRAAGRF